MKYVKILEPTVSTRFGKLAAGRIVPVEDDMAEGWKGLGISEMSSEAAYTKARDERQEKAGGGERGAALRDLSAQKSALWDVSTHRDAMTSPEEGLKAAVEAGVPLVNLGMLKDDDGHPLQSDASVKDIMDARSLLQERDPLRDHAQASTSGGGSHYYTPSPLNDPTADVKVLADGSMVDNRPAAARRGRPRKADSE